MKIKVTNFWDSLDLLGEENLKLELSIFESSKNPEIEEFAKGDEAFTLTHKSLTVNGEKLSKTAQKRLIVYNYMTSAFLLAHFGKNYDVDNGKCISGSVISKFI